MYEAPFQISPVLILPWSDTFAGSGPSQGKASFWDRSYPPPAPMSPFRNGSFLTSLLPSAGL